MPVETKEELNRPDDDAVGAEHNQVMPQPGLSLGIVVGLPVVALGTLGWAWLNRTTPVVIDGLNDTLSVLRQTTAMVGVTAGLVVAYLTAGAYRAVNSTRTKFMAYTSPTLVAAAIAGFVAWRRSDSRDVFQGAATEQAIPGSSNVQSAASVAWVISCIALVALAVVAARSYLPFYYLLSDEPVPRRPMRTAIATLLAAAVIGSATLAIATYRPSPYEGETAAGVSIPPLPDSPGREGYTIEPSRDFTIAGAGYAVVASHTDGVATKSHETIEGHGGSDGERLWWFAARNSDVLDLTSTGTGESSVLIAHISGQGQQGIAGEPFIGLDATTGERLWTKWFTSLLDSRQPFVMVADDVLLLRDQSDEAPATTVAAPHEQWTAISPRTGEVMWTRPLPDHCETRARAADNAIVMTTCDGDPDLIASVLDPRTGDALREIRESYLGIDIAQDTIVSLADTRGTHAVVTFRPTSGPYTDGVQALVDIGTGRVVHRFPDAATARFIDESSILVQTYRMGHGNYSLSIFDSGSRTTTPTGLYVGDKTYSGSPPWVALGDSWLGAAAETPVDIADSRVGAARWDYSAWVVDEAGEHTLLPNPCSSYDGGLPQLMPGALLIGCGNELTAMN
ncbi:hypothetical protein ACIGKQ_05645 [Gordonia sp. NPDC062954]|uniref:Uncharacterized protein n=1 Tax=Gordonia aquimaris TaxID=2984863 RepID=A0A9X3D213_9ACTN|nr:hypothetical protein [Gordonia aquimaris]MCX2963250.1 hypothetical protein [Gordonia aquimaris]